MADYSIGTIHSTKNYGDVEIIAKTDKSTKVRIRFLNTGYESEVYKLNITRNKIRDHMIQPFKQSTDIKKGLVFHTSKSGDILIVEYINHKKVHVMFLDTGNEKIANPESIRKGIVTDFKALGINR